MSTNAQTSAMPGTPRYEFLDWLRVIAIFVLLFFHVGMIFVGWGWHIENDQVIDSLAAPMDIAHRLRMPLLFVVAGAGMWFALKRRTARQLLGERTLRLLVPLLIGMALIVPPQVYFERLFRGEWDGGYASFLVERVLQLQPYPQGDLSWHHLWFVLYLYVYVLLLAPLLLWWKRSETKPRPGAWLYALALPLGVNEVLLKPHFPETHNLLADWYVFDHYLLLTAYGFLLASMPGSWDWLQAQRRRALAIGASIYVIALTLFELGVIERDTPADAMIANAFTWTWLMIFIGYGRRYLSFENRLLRWAREASYPIYILHQTVIVWVGFHVIQQPWQPWTKYGIVLLFTLVSCVLIYQLCIRQFAIVRIAFGMKTRELPRAAIEAPAAVV